MNYLGDLVTDRMTGRASHRIHSFLSELGSHPFPIVKDFLAMISFSPAPFFSVRWVTIRAIFVYFSGIRYVFKGLALVLLAPGFLMSAATTAKATMIARAIPATRPMSSKYHTGLLASLFIGIPEPSFVAGPIVRSMGRKGCAVTWA